MLDGRSDGHVVEAFRTDGPDGASARLRKYLRLAGVDRADLFESSIASKPVTWHDLRATYATWCAIRGDDPLKIKHRAGHETLETTMGYVRAAEVLDRELVGEVFPPLPLADLEALPMSPGVSPRPPQNHETPTNTAEAWCPQRESKALGAPRPDARAAESAGSVATVGAGEGAVDGATRGSASPAGTAPGTHDDLARLVAELVAAGQYDAARVVLDGMARARAAEGGAAVVRLDAVRAARGG